MIKPLPKIDEKKLSQMLAKVISQADEDSKFDLKTDHFDNSPK